MLINHKLYILNYTFPVSLVLLTPLFPEDPSSFTI